MRVRISLLALAMLALAAVPAALASVRASGLLCTATGGAIVSSSPDARRLPVSNIGSSGQDGVSVSLSRLDGHTMSCDTPWSSGDAGTVCSYSWGVSNAGSGGGAGGLSHGRVSLTRTPDGVDQDCDLSEMSSSSSMTCLVFHADVLVARLTVPSSFSFRWSLSSLPPGSSSRIPTVAFELDQASHRCLSSVSLESSALFVFGGVSVLADRVVCIGDLDGDGALDVCLMRCASPPSSSVHALDFDSQSFVRFGSSVVLYGGMDLESSTATMSLLSNPLYSSPEMSVSIPNFIRLRKFADAQLGQQLDRSSPPASLVFNPLNPFVLDPRVDEGAALECRVTGTGGCSPTGEVAALRAFVLPHVLEVSGRFAGMCADQESVIVYRKGYDAYRASVALGSSLTVTATPGGSPVMAVSQSGRPVTKSSSNIQNNLTHRRDNFLVSPVVAPAPGTPDFVSVVGPEGLELGISFLDERVVCVGGTCVVGDEIVFKGQCTSGSCSVITLTGSNFALQRSVTGSGGGSSMEVLDISSSSGPEVVAVNPGGGAITSLTATRGIAVDIRIPAATEVRGTSVTFHLSSNLVLASSIVESPYFSRFGTSQMFVLDNGGGSYTVDMALLGPGCGATGEGTLFTVPVARAPGAPDGLGSVCIDAVEAGDCTAGPVALSVGACAYVVLDGTSPAATTLSATQVTSGNDGDGTTKISFQLGSLAVEDGVELYRSSFGNYPLYDNAPNAGSVPTPLATPTSGGGWTRVLMSCPSSSAGTPGGACTDEPSSRDFYYYVAFVRDRFGNYSPPSAMTQGTLNYHLGDVAGGGAQCAGDNQVTTADISALGAHYGATVSSSSLYSCLDVGPTSTGTVAGRPLTDSRVSFADLMMFAINYSLVSMPANGSRPTAAATNAVRLAVPTLPAVGMTFDVALEMSGAGDAQGVSAQLGYDPAVVEAVRVSSGELLSRQGRDGVVLSSAPGNVDAALLGIGGGLAGEGVLANVTFRVKTEGDPAIGITNVQAKDAQNRDLAMAGVSVPGAGPGRTALRMAFPNPFDQSTTVVFSLRSAGPASVRVFDVAGRTVRTLLDGVQPAGERVLAWDGRDDGGSRLNAGVYMLRLDAAGHSETRAVRLVK